MPTTDIKGFLDELASVFEKKSDDEKDSVDLKNVYKRVFKHIDNAYICSGKSTTRQIIKTMLEHKPQSIFESARSVLEASFASSEEEYLKTKRIPIPSWIPKDFKKGELKPVKSARSYLGKTTEFWVIERKEVKLGRQDKFAMIAVTNPKNSISKVLAYYGSHPTADGAMKMAKNRNLIESVELEEASKAPDVKDYYDDQEDISKQWPISARKQLKFEKQKKGSVELIIVKAPSGQEMERYQLVKGNGWMKLK